MSQSASIEASGAFITHLLKYDDEIISRMPEDGKNTNEIYQLYLERLSLYEKACILPLGESEKSLLQAKKDDISVEVKLFILKQDVKKQLDETQTVLHDLKKNFWIYTDTK